VVFLGHIEELSVCGVRVMIVFREPYVEVVDPAELTVDITFLGHLGVFRHARSLDFVFLKGVKLALWVNKNALLVLKFFVEVLLIVLRILLVEGGGRYMVTNVPVLVTHTRIASVVLDEVLFCKAGAIDVNVVTAT